MAVGFEMSEVETRGGAAIPLKAYDESWKPVGDCRNAKWWYSAFHNVTAMVGAGVLGLPFAMANLTWGPGIVVLILSWTITLYTFWQLVEMHENEDRRRFDTYHELGQEAFGDRLGLWIVVPQQLVVQVSTDIVYQVTGGLALFHIHQQVCKLRHKAVSNCEPHYGIAAFIVTFSVPQFCLSQLPNFNAISFVSLAAAIMSLSYSTISWVDSVAKWASVHPGDNYYKLHPANTAHHTFQAMASLGVVAFAYAGHNVALEIQATIPSTPEKPSKLAMWQGVKLAYAIVALCYFTVAIAGYGAYGRSVQENILSSLDTPHWLIIAANLMVAIHLVGGYQVYAQPVFANIDHVLVKVFKLPTSRLTRLISRSAYVAITLFVGTLLPFFGYLLAFFGGFALAPSTYFLPCIMWLLVKKPKRFSLSWITNWICIVLGVLLMFTATIGGAWGIVENAKKFDVFGINSHGLLGR